MSRSPSLAAKLALPLGVAFASATLLLLSGARWLGENALQREHEGAALHMAALFEASLHNAMLKRDLPGLADILQEMGHLPGVRAVALLHPGGEVRFASDRQRIGQNERAVLAGMCLRGDCTGRIKPQLRWTEQTNGALLSVTYPVKNQARCATCHGSVLDSPVNGVLVLDTTPDVSSTTLWQTLARWQLPAGLAALVLLTTLLWWALKVQVLKPVATLAGLAQRLTRGDLTARSGATSGDELGRLGRDLDHMAHQQQQHLEHLNDQHRFLQSLIDAAPDPILVIGTDYRVVLANRAYAQLLGHDRTRILGQPCWRMSCARREPCVSTLVNCPWLECGPQSGSLSTVMRFESTSGQSVDVEVHAAELRGLDGQRLVLEVIRPLEDRLRFSQEQRLSAMGLLASGVAHEIHNPLASIRLALQSSIRGLNDASMSHGELTGYLRLVDSQIDRCVAITQRLMTLSQPSSPQSQPVHVATAVTDVLSLLTGEAQQIGVGVTTNVDPADLTILMDQGELRQVLLNLIQNAFHAMPQGGSLTVKAQTGANGFAVLTVQDTGMGIDAETLPRIFLPFFSRRADGHAGAGLGLAICKTLVEHRGGTLSVQSQPGLGSCFEVHMPLAPHTATP